MHEDMQKKKHDRLQIIEPLDEKEFSLLLYSYANEKMKHTHKELAQLEKQMDTIRSNYFDQTTQAKNNMMQFYEFKQNSPTVIHSIEHQINQLNNKITELHAELDKIESLIEKSHTYK
jgi:exonuclease VII small subunit